jgi:hypothetical protein
MYQVFQFEINVFKTVRIIQKLSKPQPKPHNMRLIISVFFITCICSNALFAQGYSRTSITPVYVNFRTGVDYTKSANYVSIPDKYDYNFFGSNIISVDADMISPSMEILNRLQAQLNTMLANKGTSLEQLRSIRSEISNAKRQVEIDDSIREVKIFESIHYQRVPNRILASLLIDESTKTMSLDKLAKRAEYNASDADFIKAMNSEMKMAAIRDKGLELLNNVYIIVFSTEGTSEVGAVDGRPDLKTYSHFGKSYLYKIDIDTLVKTGQFDELIFTESNQAKYDAFNAYKFPLKYVLDKSFEGTASNYTVEAESAKNMAKALLNKNSGQQVVKYVLKSQEDIDKEMVTSMFASAETKYTKEYKPFQIKISVFTSNPIQAKIGAIQSKNNEIIEKKIGWVRAKKVVDNRKNADGKTEPSIFYKAGSKKVEKGMKLTQKPETGIIIGAGYGIAKDNVMGGPYISIDYITHISPGLRMGMNIGGFSEMTPDQVYVSGVPVDKDFLDFKGTNIYGDLNIQKIIQANRIELTPFVGAYFSMLSIGTYSVGGVEQDASTTFPGLANTVIGGLAGIKFGINLGRHAQLNVGYKAGFQFSSKLEADSGEVEYSPGDPITMDFNRPGSLLFGLRLFGF